MKISKSKQELARIIRENGGWCDGEFAAQDGDGTGSIDFFKSKPKYDPNSKFWRGVYDPSERIDRADVTIKNFHQTILSREEYFHLCPAPDADGWIEWKGGECPVDAGAMVVCKVRTGKLWRNGKPIAAGVLRWSDTDSTTDIIAYCLHNPEQAKPRFCESVMRSIPEPEAKPTIEQLAADYRNAKDYAEHRQKEADVAKADAESKLAELVAAGKALGLVVGVAAPEPELVITDWWDLRVGDEIEVFNFECPEDESRRKQELMSGPCIVMQTEGGNVRIELKDNLPKRGPYWNATGVDACDFKFIRRPAKEADNA